MYARMIVAATLLLNCWAALTVHGQVNAVAGRQGEMTKSEHVQIMDAEAEFFLHRTAARETLEEIGQMTPSWRAAEEIAEALGKDPTNNRLRRQMVEARSKVLAEKMEVLKNAVNSLQALDTSYKAYVKKLDALIDDTRVAGESNSKQERSEIDFLNGSLTELIELETQLGSIGDLNAVNTGPDGAQRLSDEERQLLLDFKQTLVASEVQLDNARKATDLNSRRMVVLAETKLEAAWDYLALRGAIAHAKTDQIALSGIAHNDMTFLQILDDQQRLAELRSRPKTEYKSATQGLRGIYNFEGLPNERKTSIDQVTLSFSKEIDRLKEVVGSEGKGKQE